ncbi:MAG: M17 family peptidase N-terminal domain-containing protein, partial [Pseudomonadota bacterium]
MLKVSFSDRAVPTKGTLVLPVFDEASLGDKGAELNSNTNGLLVDFMDRRDFAGAVGSMQTITKPAGVAYDEILLVGFGDKDKLTPLALEENGGRIMARLSDLGIKEAVMVMDLPDHTPFEAPEIAARIGFGGVLRDYRFDKYKTDHGKKSDDDKKAQKDKTEKRLEKLKIITTGMASAKKLFAEYEGVAKGVHIARDLVSEPANELYPATYAKRCKE